MPHKDIRKIIKVGDSLAVTISPAWLRYYNLHEKDFVIVVSDGQITIKPMPKNKENQKTTETGT